jgi:hypothetical protein
MPARQALRCALPPTPQARLRRSISRKSELDRFLLPVDPHWHGNESAVVRTIRIQIPG